MATNETDIKTVAANLAARAAAAQSQVESYIADLDSVALNYMTSADPIVNFTPPSVSLSTDAIDITADFASGLSYPDPTDFLQLIQTGNYDSEFLEYLEQCCRNTPLASWVNAINVIRDTYRAGVAAAAATFMASFAPIPAAYSAAGVAIVTDTSDRHELDFAHKWAALTNDAAVQIGIDARKNGIAIEDVRERINVDLINIYSDYYQAILSKARTDLEAMKSQVSTIRERIDLAIRSFVLNETQNYQVAELEERAKLLTLDSDLAEISDFIRRTATSWSLQLGRAQALVQYSQQALMSSGLSSGVFSAYRNASES